MSKNKHIIKFKFLLTIDNNIITERFFTADYNNIEKDPIKNDNLYCCIKEICEDITNILNERNSDYLKKRKVVDFKIQPFHIKNIEEKTEQDYILEIIKDNSPISKIIFSGFFYHPKIRYNVNIKSETVEYLRKIKQILEK